MFRAPIKKEQGFNCTIMTVINTHTHYYLKSQGAHSALDIKKKPSMGLTVSILVYALS